MSVVRLQDGTGAFRRHKLRNHGSRDFPLLLDLLHAEAQFSN